MDYEKEQLKKEVLDNSVQGGIDLCEKYFEIIDNYENFSNGGMIAFFDITTPYMKIILDSALQKGDENSKNEAIVFFEMILYRMPSSVRTIYARKLGVQLNNDETTMD